MQNTQKKNKLCYFTFLSELCLIDKDITSVPGHHEQLRLHLGTGIYWQIVLNLHTIFREEISGKK